MKFFKKNYKPQIVEEKEPYIDHEGKLWVNGGRLVVRYVQDKHNNIIKPIEANIGHLPNQEQFSGKDITTKNITQNQKTKSNIVSIKAGHVGAKTSLYFPNLPINIGTTGHNTIIAAKKIDCGSILARSLLKADEANITNIGQGGIIICTDSSPDKIHVKRGEDRVKLYPSIAFEFLKRQKISEHLNMERCG